MNKVLEDWIIPDWDVSPNVRAVSTTRAGGVSKGVYASLNLGTHVGDLPADVHANRELLRTSLELPSQPIWLNQIHGTGVINAAEYGQTLDADASFVCQPRIACVVMTADCLPVLFADRNGKCVAAAHAGWRGLVSGVLEATIGAMPCPTADITAWLGPAIGRSAFEVGDEVREQFIATNEACGNTFVASSSGKWLADIYALARIRLARAGVEHVFGGGFCTFTDEQRFYSFRRDGQTGRMASLIWIED